MSSIKYKIWMLLPLMAMISCESILDKFPEDKITPETFFTTENELELYSNNFYVACISGTGVFKDYGDVIIQPILEKAISGQRTIPETDSNFDGWGWGALRDINFCLENIYRCQNEEVRNHYEGLARFFRAYFYFVKVRRFGDVPWYDYVIGSADTEALSKPRDSREFVMGKVLEDIDFAIDNLRIQKDVYRVTRWTALALKSRICLFEGTWRKYHALPNATTYLEECTRASKEVMNKYTTLHPNYEELFNSESLAGINGIILYKEYATSQLCHGLTRMVRTGESQIEATKDAVDSYLCSDGHPIKNSTTYGGDKDVYAQFRNRDYRLYHTVCPPYMVSLASASTTQWKFTDNPSEREYIDLMATISKETYHRLPTSNFKGFITKGQPHFKNVNWGQGWNASQMGFWVWKYYNTHTDASTANGVCTTDAPLFRLGEILLNYAEAMYELGLFDQSIADKTINKLRKRAHVADMVLTDITTDFDPERDQP